MGAEFADDEAHDRDIAPPSIDPYPEIDLPADTALGAAARIHALDAAWNRHLDAAVKADRHPFVHPGWTELHREMRDIAALLDIAAQDRKNVLEWIGIADGWLARYVPGHAAQPVEEPTPLPELGHSPGARPQAADLTAEQRANRMSTIIAAHGRRLSEHVEEAAAAGVHPFEAEGWDRLETDLRNFLLFPSISDDDRARVEERIAEIDRARQQLAAQAEAAEHISTLVARHDAHLQRHVDAAQSAGIHPFEAEGWDKLETDLRNFLLLPSISDDNRAWVEERIAEIDQGRQELAARAEAKRLYDEHIERHDSYMETLQNTLDPSEIDIDAYNNLRERGLSLLKLPGLADADRDNIECTYDLSQLAKNITDHRRRRNDLQFEAEREPYRHFSRHLARHLEAAEARDLHPYAAPGCDKIADLADKTLRNDRLTGEQHDRIHRFLSGYRDWKNAMNRISPSREQEQDRSQGMSW